MSGLRPTEHEIHDAALRLISERGYHGTSMREVAAEVGVQMSSLYHYFESKQALLLAMMSRTMGELLAQTSSAIEGINDPIDALRAAIHAHVAFHADSERAAFVTDSELRSLEPPNRARIVKLRDEYQKMIEALLNDGMQRGVFEIHDLKLTVLALLSMCGGVAAWYRKSGRLTPSQIADHHVGLFLEGIVASDTPRRLDRRG